VERALTDFGAEESFGQASQRFREHYGFEVGRTTISKVVHVQAHRAQKYVEDRLQAAVAEFEQSVAERPGEAALLVELDGCEIEPAH
jgi:hypothetical protein